MTVQECHYHIFAGFDSKKRQLILVDRKTHVALHQHGSSVDVDVLYYYTVHLLTRREKWKGQADRFNQPEIVQFT